MASNDELACIYAALILHDDGISVTADKIATILKAAGVSVEPYWPTLFAKALDGIDIGSLLGSLGSAASAVSAGPVSGGSAAASSAAAPAAAEEKEEVKEEKKDDSDEESDEDMGFSLFD